jgi:peptidoglycan hydrolase-like protein with peptidoglycan-binding domain
MSKKLLVAGVMLALVATVVGGAVVANAQSVTCANIGSMLTVLGITDATKVAQANAALGCGVAAPAAYTFTRNLTIGSTGADVTALQTKLGVTPATGYFGAITKAAVVAYQTANGIVPASGYVGPLTLAKLNYVAVTTTTTTTTTTTNTNTTSALDGGAGDLSLDDTNTGVKNSLKEGEEDVKVLGITAEADGSDIAVTSIKVTLEKASSTSDGSEKLSAYLDEVTVWMGSKKVGSADVSDFSKTSATPDTFSKTIALSDAVVEDGEDVKFYVAVSAVSDVDTEDINEDLKLTIETVRFTDATGAILTDDASGLTAQEFGFTSSASETGFRMKSSSSNPDDDTVTVEDNEDSTTDDVLALVFKIDVDDDSEDVMITSIPVVLTVSTSTATSSATIEDIVDSVKVVIDGDEYEADLSTSTVANNAGTATYTVDIDAGDVTLSEGDVVDVKVYLSFKGIEDGNYAEDTIVVASVNDDTIDAETVDDELTSTQMSGGDKDGAELTLSTSAIVLSGISWLPNTTGTFVDFFFTVKAETADFVVLASSLVATSTGNATTSAAVLSRESGDEPVAQSIGSSYTVGEGDTINFKIRYTLTGTNGLYREYTITSLVGKVIADNLQKKTVTINGL